jgi:hypothetical protein
MKLLFTTTGTTGNTELKELMGFIDADLKLKNLIPDLITATNDVIDLIGIEVYNKAVEAFNDGTISPDDKDFIYSVRYPMIWHTPTTAVRCVKTKTKSKPLSG